MKMCEAIPESNRDQLVYDNTFEVIEDSPEKAIYVNHLADILIVLRSMRGILDDEEYHSHETLG